MVSGPNRSPFTFYGTTNVKQLYLPPMNADDSKEVMNNGDERW
jgi:hypothetical protein